jgi:biotin-dependent carboxylase-like uncharacterized protein
MIEVIETGPLATVQDLGRLGFAYLGVGRSGAFDREALRLGNRLVGNDPGAAGIEVLGGGLTIRLRQASTVALTGARCGGRLDWGRATSLPAGSTIALGTAVEGVRAYLAIRGGIDVAAELGSRSTDSLGGIGPQPLRAGDQLPIGALPSGDVDGSVAVRGLFAGVLNVVTGPREDWFTAEALRMLTSVEWTVRPDSDRVGIRLDGPVLTRSRGGELPSEPTLPGALQVPPDGRPILLGPDAPVTGGYPVIAVVRDADLDLAAQLRPGQTIRLR